MATLRNIGVERTIGRAAAWFSRVLELELLEREVSDSAMDFRQKPSRLAGQLWIARAIVSIAKPITLIHDGFIRFVLVHIFFLAERTVPR